MSYVRTSDRLRRLLATLLAATLLAGSPAPLLAQEAGVDKAAEKAAADKGAAGDKAAAKAAAKPAKGTRRAKPAAPPADAEPAAGGGTVVAQAGEAPAPLMTPTPGTGTQGGPMAVSPADDGELYRCKNLPRNAKFKVTLKPESELKDLVNWAMSFTCRNFIFGQGIMGRATKVTIIAPNEMTPAEAWNLFLVAISTMNLNVVPRGKTLEIVESQQTKEKPLPVYRAGAAPSSEQIVRAIFRPENMSVDDATQVFNTLKSKDGLITPMPNMGVIVVTDYGSHIDKMAEMMRAIDEPSEGERVYIIPIKNADAIELAAKLNEIFAARGGAGGQAAPVRPARDSARPSKDGSPRQDVNMSAAAPSKIIADERTNALLVIASEPAYARILALVKRLDAPVEGGQGSIHVYYLSNADAEEMSNTLSSVISGAQRPAGGAGGGRPQAQAAGGAGGGGSAAFEGNVRVSFDKPTNSLVIVSSVKDFLSLREVIRRLDVPRRQVFVEATILEVSLDRSRRMGVAFHGGVPYSVAGQDSLILGGVQHGDLGTLNINAQTLASGGGLGAAFGPEIPEATQVLGFAIPSFGVMFQLLQNSNDVNVLSSPHILTTDNIPAEISIGQNIPVASGTPLTGAGGGAGGGLGLSFGQPVQRQDVGLKLKITPHVNDSDMVRLEIEQEINAIASENFGGLGASWTKRSVKTTVVVKDQQPVIIGGLMNDETRLTESKVPLLGDIPILGYLFKFQRKSKQKTNLIIFLTPYIIKDQSDLRRIFDKKMRERREFIRSYTMFQDTDFSPDIDYRRKRGLIEEINHTVRVADEDEQMLRAAEARQQDTDSAGPVEMTPAGPPEAAPAPAPAPAPKVE